MNNLIINDYISTNHFAINNSEFKSIINVYNYYGFAFKDLSEADTDSIVYVHFYNENGESQGIIEKEIKTGESLHIDTSIMNPNFSGLISTHMVPNGKMNRLSYKMGTKQRPISTSYFIMYERFKKYRDFSHVLYPVSNKIEKINSEWMTMIYIKDDLKSSVVIMNKCPNEIKQEFKSKVTVEAYDNNFGFLKFLDEFELMPGGSKIVNVSKNIRELLHFKSIIIKIKGNNIEQPMSLNYHDSGDFNFHHF